MLVIDTIKHQWVFGDFGFQFGKVAKIQAFQKTITKKLQSVYLCLWIFEYEGKLCFSFSKNLFLSCGVRILLIGIAFCFSYVLDINMDRVEDVLLHQKILALAKDPEKRPVYHVRFLEVHLSSNQLVNFIL